MWPKFTLSFVIVLGHISQVYSTNSGYFLHGFPGSETGTGRTRLFNKLFPRSVRSFTSPPPPRLMRDIEGKRKLSPLLGLEEGETLRNDDGGSYDNFDVDCIPNDGSDTGELHMGSLRSSSYGVTPVPYKPKKDDCYGLYSPRCKMFNRFTSAYRAEQAEHKEVGFRRRRQNPQYNPVSDPRNSRQSHLALLRPSRSNTPYQQPAQQEYAGIPDMRRQRFKRDLGRLGFGRGAHRSYSFPASMGFGGRRRRVPLSPKRVEADADADYSLPPSNNLQKPTSVPGRIRKKCPERRVRPEYAYWKTRLSEDFRRREILKGSKKMGALRHNQQVMGRSSDPSWLR